MSDLKRISFPAIVFLVLLRMSIGWQFLYEGLWKYNTLQTSHAWSSEGYLKNAQGPFREHFREMTGDPDDLKWLDYAAMDQRWKGWRDRFVAHYGLDEGQTERLDRLLTGPEQHAASVSAVPESARPALEKLSNVVAFDAVKGRLTVRGDTPLRPDEAAALLGLSPRTLERRRTARNPVLPHVEVVPGRPRYRLRDVLAHLDRARVPARSAK